MFVNVMSNASESNSNNGGKKFDPYSNHEHLRYYGTSSELEVRQRFRIIYKCT